MGGARKYTGTFTQGIHNNVRCPTLALLARVGRACFFFPLFLIQEGGSRVEETFWYVWLRNLENLGINLLLLSLAIVLKQISQSSGKNAFTTSMNGKDHRHNSLYH